MKAEMVATHRSLQQQITQANNISAKEDTKMSFDPSKPESLDEYNETLSHTYAMTYEHMKNNPTLSQEEFIQQASTMSEKCNDASQEFQDAKTETNVSMTEGFQSVESNGIQADSNLGDATGISAADNGAVDSGVNGGGIGGDNIGGIGDDDSGGGVDNDGDGVDDGLDI